MDPLDQRLADAGAAWRRTQPEPPNLDRMLIALRGRRSTIVPGRLMYAFVAALLLMAALVVAPGVGGFLHKLDSSVSVPTATPSAPPSEPVTTPSPTPASPEPTPTASSPEPSSPAVGEEARRAVQLVHDYETALVGRHWQDAFDLLAPSSPTHQQGFAAYRDERSAFFASVGGAYDVGSPSRVTDWAAYDPLVTGADRSHRWLVEVGYSELAGNNAGYEQFVIAPDSTGTWRIWPVR